MKHITAVTDKVEAFLELGGAKKDITLLVISGIALLISIFDVIPLPFDAAWIAIILCGVPIIMEAIIGLVTAFDIKADVLVSLALVAAVLIREDFAAGEVAFIMQLGALLEDLTVARARAGIEKLVHLTPQTARVIGHKSDSAKSAVGTLPKADAQVSDHAGDSAAATGEETIIPAEQVQVGDILRVLPGETIPVDGVILTGQTSINQAVMTGESLPVDKTAGDEVSSGTVNQFGAFTMEATKVGEDSSIQRMIRLVQSADAGKAKIVGIADRWATWIVVIALSAATLTWIISGEIIRAVTILVVFCPCALVLATPTAIMAAIGNATKHGFLVREGDALERLASVTKITFDKTGTLTYGTPEVVAVESSSPEWTQEQVFALAASVEQLSEHPLGKAVVSSWQNRQLENQQAESQEFPASRATQETLVNQGNNPGDLNKKSEAKTRGELFAVEEFEMIPGRGVTGSVDGKRIVAGNEKMMAEREIPMDVKAMMNAEKQIAAGRTVIWLAADDEIAGYLVLADTLRKESPAMINRLWSLGVSPVLLTGDHQNAANTIAQQLGIYDVYSDCLPEDKLNHIDEYQKNGEPVCMVGDGVNDAPALKKATVGIAMGGVGSDIAVDAADIALVDDEVKELPHLLGLAKRMMITIKCNLTFSLGLNFVAIVLAILGILGPVIGALVHNAGSILVIINSALLLGWKKR